MTNSTDRENVQSTQLARDIFATTEDEPDYGQLEAMLIMAAEAALSDEESKARFPQLWQHFALYLNAEQEYRLLVELLDAEASNTLIRPATLPPMPTQTAMPASLHQLVQQSVEQGKRWVQDAAGNVYVWLASALQPVDNTVWITRSGQPSALIFQETLSGIQGVESWEITVSATTETEQTYRIAISLYDLNDPNADLGDVLVSLQSGTVIASTETTIDGQATFIGVTKAALAQLAVRIDIESLFREVQ